MADILLSNQPGSGQFLNYSHTIGNSEASSSVWTTPPPPPAPPPESPNVDQKTRSRFFPKFRWNFRGSGNLSHSPEHRGSDVNPTAGGNREIDLNVYQQKKTLAQGMMDLALLSANANQLRYVLESEDRHPYYYPSLVFITLSLIMQVAVGVGLIINSRYNVEDTNHVHKADRVNNFTVLGIFLITIVNVFISSFGVADPPSTGNEHIV